LHRRYASRLNEGAEQLALVDGLLPRLPLLRDGQSTRWVVLEDGLERR
jgi:hypothetical protein